MRRGNRGATVPTWIGVLWIAAGALTGFSGEALPEYGADAQQGWRLVRERDGVRIFHRAFQGSAIPEARANAIIASPPGRVYAAIVDYDHFAEFVPYVVDAKIMRRKDHLFWVYQRLRFPWPVAERRFVIEAIHEIDHANPGFYTVRWRLAERETAELARESGIAPAIFAGYWELRPLNGGAMTDATYGVHLDPGGLFPAWLVRMATDDLLPNVIRAIRQRAEYETDDISPSGRGTGGL